MNFIYPLVGARIYPLVGARSSTVYSSYTLSPVTKNIIDVNLDRQAGKMCERMACG